MGKETFDYKYTCPDIDSNIQKFKERLVDRVRELFEELNPLYYSTDEGVDYVDTWVDFIYDDAEACFEDVRTINSDMRKSAEYQIEEVVEARDEYKRLAEFWESEFDKQEKVISELQSNIINLENELEQYE